MKSTIYALYNDGTHIACYDTIEKAVLELDERGKRYDEVEAEDFYYHSTHCGCDCGNDNITIYETSIGFPRRV